MIILAYSVVEHVRDGKTRLIVLVKDLGMG